MDILQEYAFVDCLMLRFTCDSVLRNLTLWCEAYFPPRPGEIVRQRGIVELQLFDCTKTNARLLPEFWEDLRKPYANGSTYKANEIDTLSLCSIGESSSRLLLVSDMMQLEVECARAVVNAVDRSRVE